MDVDTAKRNLQLQKPAGELEVALTKNEGRTYAGQWLEHVPEFKVVVQFTDGDERRVKPYIEDGPLEDRIEVRQANLSMSDLRELQHRANDIVSEVQPQFESLTNVMNNRVEIRVLDRSELESRLEAAELELPESVSFTEVDELHEDSVGTVEENSQDEPQLNTLGLLGSSQAWASHVDLYGGLETTVGSLICTTGFVVRHNQTNVAGILTSGHCSNSPRYHAGHLLTYQAQAIGVHYDVQWYTSSLHTLRNQVVIDLHPYVRRDITGMITYDAQNINGWVCLFGSQNEHESCGQVVSKTHKPPDSYDEVCDCYVSFDPWFVLVGGQNLAVDGDSGGPWYSGNDAWGVHKSSTGSGDEASYMPVNRIGESLDLSVVESCPSQGC